MPSYLFNIHGILEILREIKNGMSPEEALADCKSLVSQDFTASYPEWMADLPKLVKGWDYGHALRACAHAEGVYTLSVESMISVAFESLIEGEYSEANELLCAVEERIAELTDGWYDL